MMYRCAPATSGSGKIVKKRGKSLRVDIHCHYLDTEAAAAVARHNPAQFDFLARFSNQLTRTVNERIAEIVAQWPERFVGLGTVPLQDAGLAVSELDYCVKQLGLRGVEINPSVNGLDLTQQRDRQPARDHGRGEPSHLRRRDAAFPEAEGPAAARRRLPRAWTMRTAPARIAGSA